MRDSEAVAMLGELGLCALPRMHAMLVLDLRKTCGMGGSGEVPRPGERRLAGKLTPGDAQKEREISSRPLAWLG